MKSIEEIRDYFAGDIFATKLAGVQIAEVAPGYCRVELQTDERHKNAAGKIMGAVYFTMADLAFAVANNASLEKPYTVTLSSQMDFLHPAKGSFLTAEARAVRSGGQTSVYNVEVRDDCGVFVASASFTGFRSRSAHNDLGAQ